jgi:hypothetical protein
MEKSRESAKVIGHRMFSVRDHVYPALYPEQGSAVKGWLLHFDNDKPLELLDRYEGDRYKRLTVDIQVESILAKERMDTAEAYVWNKDVDLLDCDPWIFAHFIKYHEKVFLEHLKMNSFSKPL